MPVTQSIDLARAERIGQHGVQASALADMLKRSEAALDTLRRRHKDGSLPLLRLPARKDDLPAIRDVATRLAAGATDIAIGIGITADPKPTLESFAKGVGLQFSATLYVYPKAGPSVTAVTKETAGSLAALIKDEMRRFISKREPRTIHLFYVGPLGLAVLLGQRLNSLGDIQCYERSRTDGYVPSCRLLA